MPPITWRNINNPNFNDSNRLRESGLNSIDRGLSKLSGLSSDIHQERQAKNTNDVLAQIRGLNSLESLEQAKADGTFNREQFNNNNFDVNAIDKALAGREDEIRRKITDDFNFSEFVRKRDEKPQADLINNLISSGNFSEAESKLEESNIQDKSSLYNALTNKHRDDIAYNRKEDAYQDEQASNKGFYGLLDDKAKNIEEARKIQNTFADQHNGVSFDGAGTLILDPNMDKNQKEYLTNLYNQTVKPTLPSVLSGKQQEEVLRNQHKQRNLSPAKSDQIINALRSVNQQTKSLTPEQENFFNSAKANIAVQDKQQRTLIEDEYNNDIARLPISDLESVKDEKIKMGDALKYIREDLGKDENVRGDEDRAVVEDISRYAREKNYPGWLVQEAYNRAGGLAGVIKNTVFGTESVETDNVKAIMDELAILAQRDEDNKIKRSELKKLRDSRLIELDTNNIRALSAYLNKAKADSGVYDERNLPSARLERSINSIRQR